MQLEDLPETFLVHSNELESLDLSENLFTIVPDALQYAPALEVLFFNANPILELNSER